MLMVRHKKRHKRTRARDFGDNPRIRRKYGEKARINLVEPWERRYAKIKRVKARKKYKMREYARRYRKRKAKHKLHKYVRHRKHRKRRYRPYANIFRIGF